MISAAGLAWVEAGDGVQSVWQWSDRAGIESWAEGVRKELALMVQVVQVSAQPLSWALRLPAVTSEEVLAQARRPISGQFRFQPDRNVYEGLTTDGKVVRSSAEEYRQVSEACEADGIFLTPDWALEQRPSCFFVVLQPDAAS